MADESLAIAPAPDAAHPVDDLQRRAIIAAQMFHRSLNAVAIAPAPDAAHPVDDPQRRAIIAAQMFHRSLNAVAMQQQARIDMQDLIDVMIAQIRGEL